MSLSIFGKVVGGDAARLAASLSSIALAHAVTVAVDQLEVEDREALEESDHLKRPGVFFAISGDAAPLWIDAMTRVRQRVGTADCEPDQLPREALDDFLRTALGQICRQVLDSGSAAGVALVDGGIERIFVASREACLRRMACDVVRTWDQAPNRLYVVASR